MDKKDEFRAEHIQPREDQELQQRYSNRNVSSKAQMYVQKKRSGRGNHLKCHHFKLLREKQPLIIES